MNSLEFFINIIIIGLLIPTIIYAYRLNKNLNILRQNQSSLAKLIEALNEATFKAENSIPKLKSVTQNSSEGLKEVVDSAKTLKEDLMFINQRANSLADRLENTIRDNRKVSDNVLSPAGGDILSDKKNKKNTEAENYMDEDARSEAEIELLKALRSIK